MRLWTFTLTNLGCILSLLDSIYGEGGPWTDCCAEVDVYIDILCSASYIDTGFIYHFFT